MNTHKLCHNLGVLLAEVSSTHNTHNTSNMHTNTFTGTSATTPKRMSGLLACFWLRSSLAKFRISTHS